MCLRSGVYFRRDTFARDILPRDARLWWPSIISYDTRPRADSVTLTTLTQAEPNPTPGTATGQYTLFALCSTITNAATVENPCNVQRRMDELQGYFYPPHPFLLFVGDCGTRARICLPRLSRFRSAFARKKCHICSLRIRVSEWDVWEICSCLDTLHNRKQNVGLISSLYLEMARSGSNRRKHRIKLFF